MKQFSKSKLTFYTVSNLDENPFITNQPKHRIMKMSKPLALVLVLVFFAVSSVMDGRFVLGISEVDTAISILPSSVEVAQAVDIKILIEPLPPSASDHFHGLTLTVTRPDGVKNTYEPLESTDGSFIWSYMIKQTGKL